VTEQSDKVQTEQSITVTFEIGCITGSIAFDIVPPLTGEVLDSLLTDIKEEIEENEIEIIKIVTKKDQVSPVNKYLEQLGIEQ
jgi:hypothetical protein